MKPVQVAKYESIRHEAFELPAFPVLPLVYTPSGDFNYKSIGPETGKAAAIRLSMLVGSNYRKLYNEYVLPVVKNAHIYDASTANLSVVAIWRSYKHDWDALLRPDGPAQVSNPPDGYKATFMIPFVYNDLWQPTYVTVATKPLAVKVEQALSAAYTDWQLQRAQWHDLV